MPKPNPKPAPVVTSIWTRQTKPGQIEALRAALFAPTIRRVQR